MLLRLAYLGVTNALALLWLLPMSERDKGAEILALRHQIMVLERQLSGDWFCSRVPAPDVAEFRDQQNLAALDVREFGRHTSARTGSRVVS